MDKALYTLPKARCGIGGLHCPCCNPRFGKFRGPGSQRNRQAAKRALRRSQRQENRNAGEDTIQELLQELQEERNQLIEDLALNWGLTGLGITQPYGY
jgi:hypothetical protein